MIKIDRMELEDVGGNPSMLAKAVLGQLPDVALPIPVREIAKALDIYDIREKDNIGFEGALITTVDKSEGAIIVRGDRNEERKRYTIGHELCHYLSPWHKSDNPEGFQCTAKYLAIEKSAQNDRYMKMEAEANEFSAELLMPENQIKNFLKPKRGADLEHIIELAELCGVSKEAMARRYVELNSIDPAAVVFSKDNIIRYVKKHHDFPWLNVRHRSSLPIGAASQDDKLSIGQITSWTETKTGVWVDAKPGLIVFEQTIAQANGYRLTLLTHEVDQLDGFDEDDDIDIEDSWAPKFARGR